MWASYFFYLLLTVEIVVHTIVADVEDAMVVEERVVAAVLTNVTMGVPDVMAVVLVNVVGAVAIRATLIVAIVMIAAVDVNQRAVGPVVEADILGEHVAIVLERVPAVVLVPPPQEVAYFIL